MNIAKVLRNDCHQFMVCYIGFLVLNCPDDVILFTLHMIFIQKTREHRINFLFVMYKLENKLDIFGIFFKLKLAFESSS